MINKLHSAAEERAVRINIVEQLFNDKIDFLKSHGFGWNKVYDASCTGNSYGLSTYRLYDCDYNVLYEFED